MSMSVTAPQGEGQSTRGASAAPASCAGDQPGAQGRFDDELRQAYWVPSAAWRGQAQEVYVRPARCQHGGHTRAVL